jgi:hypothetical protein
MHGIFPSNDQTGRITELTKMSICIERNQKEKVILQCTK